MAEMKRSLGAVGLMFTAIAGIMGSAWLFGPYYAAKMSGPAALLAWVVGGVAMMVIAMTLAELVCMFPISGGNARFMHFSHGTLASFVFSWLMWLGYAAVAPVETMGVLQYLASVFPALTTVKEGVTVLTTSGYGVAALVLLLMCVLNFLSVKWVSYYNSVIVWFKLLVPLIVVIALVTTVFQFHNFHQVAGFMPAGWSSVASTLSLGGVVFAFAGYAPAIVLAGEAKNPQRTVPLVLIGALSICLLIYLLLEVAFIGAINPHDLSLGWTHLHFPHDSSPFVGIGQQLGLHYLSILIFITAILAPLGTAFIFIATSSRVAYAMSQNGYFPHAMMHLNRRGVPFMAVILNFVVGLLLFFPAPGWQGMVGFLVSAFVLCYVIGPVSLLAFRTELPEQKRSFRLPYAPVWSYVAFVVANLIVYWTGWHILSKMLVAIVIGFAVLACMRLSPRGRQRGAPVDFRHGFWVIGYLVLMGLVSYLGDYGGGLAVIPRGSDIVVIALFSVLILWWAWASRLPKAQIEQHVASITDTSSA